MIRRFYVHNFKCLENFELPVAGLKSVLLIGRNGSGKTAVGRALEILQRIGRGINRVGNLVEAKDLFLGRSDAPMRFELEVELHSRVYEYVVAFELPPDFRELRVLDEKLAVDGEPVYTRVHADVTVPRTGQNQAAKFRIDWHLVALPIVQERSPKDPIFLFKQWLARMLVLRPMPSLITGDSDSSTLQPDPAVTSFGAWFRGLLTNAPAAYSKMDEFLRNVMPDLIEIRNPERAKDSQRIEVEFGTHLGVVSLPFGDLSDGEKCFMICALVLAAQHAQRPLLCFWDEPDNYLALDEVGHFVVALRKAFESGGQFIATSHNPEGIRRFSGENTLVLYRKSFGTDNRTPT